MESVGALGSLTGASSNLLSLPAPCPWDEDDETLGLDGIKPKSSPIPRRRSSASSEDSLPPPSSTRRVSFADAFGLSLVSVKQFDAWGSTAPSGPLESELVEDKEYYMVPLFTLPQTSEELLQQVHQHKLELESLELLSGTTTLRGIVRVLNVCFDKMVYVRTSLDSWRSHFDLLAEYIPGSNCSETDSFSFKLTLVPPFGEEGTRVDFCLRYDTTIGTFWANNNEKNYSLFCCEKIKEKPQNECENRRKSCLKAISTDIHVSTGAATNAEEIPSDVHLNSVMAADPGSANENIEKLENESKELVEEISRIRSRKNRRRAVRLAKVKEHFAKREEEKTQRTKTEESEVTDEISMQENASVVEKTPNSLVSPQNTEPSMLLSPSEPITSVEYSESNSQDEDNTRISSSLREQSVGYDESISCSASDVLDGIQVTDEFNDQNVSITQNPDLSVCENVERAWEHFEKDAKKRIKTLALSSEKDEESMSLKMTNSEPQLSSHEYTFGTIVAPLYHEAFKNMETERKEFFPKAFQEERSFRELEEESKKEVMSPENTDIWPESCIVTKQTAHEISVSTCQESAEQNSQPTVNLSKNACLEPNKSKNAEKVEASNIQADYTSTIGEVFVETNFPKVTSVLSDPLLEEISPMCTFALTELSFQDDPHHSLCLVPLQEPDLFITINQTTDSVIDNQAEEIHPSSTTLVMHSCIESEVLQSQEEPTNIQTEEYVLSEHSISTIQSQHPKDPIILQTFGSRLGSSDDKLDPECSQMRLSFKNLEESSQLATSMSTDLENTQINMSNASESSHTDEKKEQMFATETSETERSSIIGFDGQHKTAIKLGEEIHNIRNDESLEEEQERNRKQMERHRQEKDEKGQVPREQENVNEKHEDKRGIKNIEDEFKYIDDEEELDAVETEADKPLLAERDSEEQTIRTSNVDFDGDEDSETAWQESSEKSDTELSGSMQAMESDWDLIEFIDKEETVLCESENNDDANNMLENLNQDLENSEDNTSTESQIDDEMEIYLNCLRNSQQSVFREAATGVSYTKRPSVCRGRPLAMPSISESVDEDQPNSTEEDLAQLDRATLLIVDGKDRAVGRNVLWWKEFLSYDNMSRVIGYTILLIVFMVTAYYYDFMACFAFYLLTVYWLFHQGEEKPLKNSRNGERRMQ